MRPGVFAIALTAAGLSCSPAAASAASIHVVSPGESLTSVAAGDGLTISQLATANGLSTGAELIAGTHLVIPPQEGAASQEGEAPAEGAPSQQTSNSASGSYVVQPGDTLTAIAERDGTTVEQLAASNGIEPNAPLLAGITLNLGGSTGAGTGSGSSTATTSTTSPQPEGAVAEGAPGGPPFPTAETVSPEQVGAIAEANGVPASLAKGIAEQESGFNNGLVSSANARGVMQITPGTWSWIQKEEAGQSLGSSSAQENVRGGVLLLHALLQATGGNQSQAIAGYYQGLESVRNGGLDPSTEQYVSDVQALQQGFGGG
jgi:LysM repeat protein